MTEGRGLFSPGFLAINLLFALVTAIAALFFAFSGYLSWLGVAPATAGFIISADALASLVVQPFITPLVHPAVSRRWLVAGSLIFSAALFLTGHVTTVPLLVACRLLQGTGFICTLTALITIVVGFIPPDMSGRAFGWISLIRLIPYAVIPPLFDVMKLAPPSFVAVLNVAGLAALVPVLALALPETGQAGEGKKSPSPGFSGMFRSLRSPAIAVLLASALLFFSAYSAVFFYLRQFGAALGIARPSLFFTIATVMMIVVRLWGGWLFDRYSKVMLCMGGLLAAALSYALLPLCPSDLMFRVLAGLAGLGWGIAMPLQAAFMFDISAPEARGMNQNLLIVMMQGGFFLGPLLGGQVISHYGFGALFVFLAGITFMALIMMGWSGGCAKKPMT